MKRKRNKPGRSSLNQSNTDLKLSRIAIHYEYLFEWGINFKDRSITLSNDVDEGMFDIVDAAITEMETESKKTITIKLNSFGGSVYDALGIVGRMKKAKCPIITEGYGKIMSAATLILAAANINGKKGKRRISELAWFMHHEASVALEETMKVSELEAYNNQLKRENKQWAYWMARLSKKPDSFWLEKGVLIDVYFTPEDLLRMGVVDEIF